MAEDIFRTREFALMIGIQPDLVMVWIAANDLIGG
jgi:hypothetical protein